MCAVLCHVTCQKVKPDLRPAVVAQQPLPIPADRWEVVSMDWITGLPMTRAGVNAVLTVTDNTTGRVRLLRTSDTATTEETARLFLENVFAQHGLPRKIISDRDPKLTAAFWQELMKLLETQLGMSTAGYAQADGRRAERTNQSVENVLRALVDYNQADWDTKSFAVEFAINSHVNASTGFSPFMMDLGREPATPAALVAREMGAASGQTAGEPWTECDRSMCGTRQAGVVLEQADVVARGLGDSVVSQPRAVCSGRRCWLRGSVHGGNNAGQGPELS